MGHTIVEDPSSYAPTLTMPDNGELADAAVLEALLAKIASRAGWLKALATVTGVPKIANVSSVTNLKAIDVSTVSNGDVRIVEGSGLYQYDSGSSATEALPWIAQPNAGAGRWVHILASYAPTNRLVDPAWILDLFGYSNGTTSYTTVLTITHHNCQVGDELAIDWHAAWSSVGAGGSWSEIFITDGGVETAQPGTTHKYAAAREGHSGVFRYTVTNAGDVIVKLKAKSDTSGTTATDVAGTQTVCPSMRSHLHRP